MTAVYKLSNTEIALNGTGNTVYSAKLVRVTNANNSLTVCAVSNTTSTVANVTLTPYETIILEKQVTDLLTGVNLKAVPIAYRN